MNRRGTFDDDIRWGIENSVFHRADPQVRTYLDAYLIGGVVDPAVISFLVGQVHRAKEQLRREPFLPPRGLSSQQVILCPEQGIGVKRHDFLLAHSLYVGGTRSGKSVTALGHEIQLWPHVEGLAIFGMHKSDDRGRLVLLRRIGQQLVVLRGRETDRWNLLQPEGDVNAHITFVTTALTEQLELPPHASTMLHPILHRLYKKFDNEGVWPTLWDVWVEVRNDTAINAASRAILVQKLASLLESITPRVGAWRQCWRSADLSKHRVVFELSGLREDVKHLRTAHYILPIVSGRVQRGLRRGDGHVLVVLDDAQSLLAKKTRALDQFEELAGLILGLKVTLMITVQGLSHVAQSLLANVGNYFLQRPNHPDDWTLASKLLGMNKDQLEWARQRVSWGTGVARVFHGPERRPFVIHPHNITLPKVSTRTCDESVKILDYLSCVFAEEFRDWDPYDTVQVQAAPEHNLTNTELKLLKTILAHPMTKWSELRGLTGMGNKAGATARKGLLDKALVTEVSVQISGTGRPSKVLTLTCKGEHLIDRLEGAP